LLVGRGGDKRILRTRIIIFDNGTSLAKCPSCKSEVVVPIKLVDGSPDKPAAQDGNDASRGSSKSERKRTAAGLERLAGDLEQLCGPFSAQVRSMLGNGGGGATKAQIEKLRGCKVHIRQLEQLIEHVLNVTDSGAAIARNRKRF
jgi:hypothetical protein